MRKRRNNLPNEIKIPDFVLHEMVEGNTKEELAQQLWEHMSDEEKLASVLWDTMLLADIHYPEKMKQVAAFVNAIEKKE